MAQLNTRHNMTNTIAAAPAWLIDGAASWPTLILAHGAGAPMDTPFMTTIAEGLAANQIRVIRFEFDYMAKRREDGKKRGPNTQKLLLQAWRDTIKATGIPPDALYIGGKSMGGRIASMLADELNVKGLVCLGYPFHPTGKPEKLRTAHLEALATPALFCQGERDAFGTKEEVATYALSDSIEMAWLTDGDHSFKPRKKSGTTLDANLTDAISAITGFIHG